MNKNKTYIMSDSHFGHRNIIKYCDRPENVDKIMVHNIQSMVKETDTFVHIGDFALTGRLDMKQAWLDKILAKNKILILGNHDRQNKIHKLNGWTNIYSKGYVLEYSEINIHFNHYPQVIDENSKRNSIYIHGHVHNRGETFTWYSEYNILQVNACVEKWNYCPFDIETVISKFRELLK